MPNLDITVNWMPVDYAGNAIADIMMTTATQFPVSADRTIFHIVNVNEISWSTLLTSMRQCGMQFDVIDPVYWVEEIAKDQKNPCYKLLGSYQKLFVYSQSFPARWETSNTRILAPNMKEAPTVGDQFPIYLQRWEQAGFYHQ